MLHAEEIHEPPAECHNVEVIVKQEALEEEDEVDLDPRAKFEEG